MAFRNCMEFTFVAGCVSDAIWAPPGAPAPLVLLPNGTGVEHTNPNADERDFKVDSQHARRRTRRQPHFVKWHRGAQPCGCRVQRVWSRFVHQPTTDSLNSRLVASQLPHIRKASLCIPQAPGPAKTPASHTTAIEYHPPEVVLSVLYSAASCILQAVPGPMKAQAFHLCTSLQMTAENVSWRLANCHSPIVCAFAFDRRRRGPPRRRPSSKPQSSTTPMDCCTHY